MSEVQAPQNNSLDPRWIARRVSRINLGITIAGALLALPILWLIRDVSPWALAALILALSLSLAWDLWSIFLKDRDAVGAFYLFDLDNAVSSATENTQIVVKGAGGMPAKLGIRIRLANIAKHPLATEREGTVLPKTFVSPWFTALRYRLPDDPPWRRFWPRLIHLWPDGLDAQEFRRIRVMLKWK